MAKYCKICGRRGTRISLSQHHRQYHADDEKHPARVQLSERRPSSPKEFDPQRAAEDAAHYWSGVNSRTRAKAESNRDVGFADEIENAHRTTPDDVESEILERNRRGHNAERNREVRETYQEKRQEAQDHMAELRERYGTNPEALDD